MTSSPLGAGAGTSRATRPQPLRSGLLGAWLGAWLDGRAAADDVLATVQGDDEPHTVLGLPDEDGPVALAWALGALRRAAPQRVRVVLPVPGDAAGLAGTALRSGMEAGQAVVIDAGPSFALVPVAEQRGRPGDTLTTVAWHVHPLEVPRPAAPAAPLTLREAEVSLAAAVRDAAAALTLTGGTSPVTPDVAHALRGLRSGRGSGGDLPPGSPALAVRVLATADRLAQVVALAGDEGPVSAAGRDRRAAALQEVATAVRRARAVAWSACASPTADGWTP